VHARGVRCVTVFVVFAVDVEDRAIAFNIEHQPGPLAPVADQLLAGQRFSALKLTPRLVAKLLTQSYGGAVVGTPDYLKNNPVGLTFDPEFLDLNPEYKGFTDQNRPAPESNGVPAARLA